MTKREFLQAVIVMAKLERESDIIVPREEIVDKSGNIYVKDITMDDLIDFAKAEIVKLDERNANRSSKPTKTQIENEPIKEKILEVLSTGEKMVASAIAERLEISTQKASALCRQLVESKKLKVEDVKIPKKGKQKAYMVNTAATEEDAE